MEVKEGTKKEKNPQPFSKSLILTKPILQFGTPRFK